MMEEMIVRQAIALVESLGVCGAGQFIYDRIEATGTEQIDVAEEWWSIAAVIREMISATRH